jgi:hypothetical protein
MHALRRSAPGTPDQTQTAVARLAQLLAVGVLVMVAVVVTSAGVAGVTAGAAHAQDDVPADTEAADTGVDTDLNDVLVPGTPPTAASNGAPTTLEAVVETERQPDSASRTVSLIIAALLTIALILTLCTFLYWHRTRPEQPDRAATRTGRDRADAAPAANGSSAGTESSAATAPAAKTKTKGSAPATRSKSARATKNPPAAKKKKTAPKTIPQKRNENQPEQAPHLKEAAEKRAAQKQLTGTETTTEKHRAEIGER